MYKLQQVRFDGGKEFVVGISEEEAKAIIDASKFLGRNMRAYYYYQIVKRNLNSLIQFIEQEQGKQKVDAIECNRLLYNFVDTFYSYINFFEKNYKNKFLEVKTELYDKYFEYRFVYNLRNYLIHEDLAVMKVSYAYYNDHVDTAFLVAVNDLICAEKIKIKFKEELKSLKEKDISIYEILVNFGQILVELQVKMLIALSDEIEKSFTYIRSYIQDMHDVFLIKDTKTINGLLNVLTKYYSNLALNFVYTENLLVKNVRVKEIFMKLSYIYYQEKDVILKID